MGRFWFFIMVLGLLSACGGYNPSLPSERPPAAMLMTATSPPEQPARNPVSTPGSTLPPSQKISPSVTPVDPAWAVKMACQALVYHGSNPQKGRIARFVTPVEVNTRGIPAAVEALRVVEAKTSGVITFKLVEQDPQVGIIFVVGDAVRPDGTPGCGNVTSQSDPRSGVRLDVSAAGVIKGRMYVHLGGINSPNCKYSPDRTPYPIAEHELGHALGLGLHFTNFNGDEGFSNELAAVLRWLYSQPAGMDAAALCK